MRGRRAERRRPRALLWIAVALLAARPAPAGLSAEALFVSVGIPSVSVSPDGKWAVAHAVSGALHALLLQKLETGSVTPVLTSDQPIRDLWWLGRDTLLLTTWSGWGVVGRIRDDEIGVRLEETPFTALGSLVSPLPLEDDTLIWEVDLGGRNTVHRISPQELVDSKLVIHRRRRSSPLTAEIGTTLASIDGSALRWVVDRQGRPRAALALRSDVYRVLFRPSPAGRLREVHRFEDLEGEDAIFPLHVSEDGRELMVAAYGDGDTRGIYRFDPGTGATGELVFRREDVDIIDALFDPIHGQLIAAIYEDGGERRYHYLDAPTDAQLSALSTRDSSDSLRVVSRSADRRVYIVGVFGPRNPGTYYFRDENRDLIVPVARVATQLDETDLAPVSTLHATSADGTRVEAFLTLPPSRGEPAPLVVHPHGGPIGVRDNKDYNPLVQYLASWGYAVLQVNYRGSAGYGRNFRDAGRKEWARGIEDDIDAAVEFVVRRPEIDAERLCIVGGSYGGFSALASVVRHEGRYRCAVTINGVTDIPLMFDTSDFADDERSLERFAENVGDVETQRDQLIERSPAYHVDRIQTPVFVIHGTEDRRVDPDHSHRLLLMLETLGKEHESFELEGAGHGFDAWEWVVVSRSLRRYLAKHLFPSRPFVPDPEGGEAPHLELPGVQR